ncbi:MAG: hypothetical protein QXP58_02380, partial [Thermoprotei archaeon]
CVGFTLIFAKRRRLAVVGVDRKMGLESGMGLGANTGLVYPPVFKGDAVWGVLGNWVYMASKHPQDTPPKSVC